MLSLAIQTAVGEVLTSSEFCSAQRRIAHLLTMYGFLLYVVTTVIMVFAYPTTATPAILPSLWYIDALMVCLGGYWFWFFIRAGVVAEGNSPFRLVRADLFIVSLCERDAGSDMGVRADARQHHLGKRVPGFVSPRHDGVVRINFVVQVLICSSSRRRPSRNGWNRRMARGETCRPPPNDQRSLAAPADHLEIISSPTSASTQEMT
jgi:hypothetical protein